MKKVIKDSHIYGYDDNSRDYHINYESAKIIVPLLHKIFKPLSVLDVGCGLGHWLSVFHENGINDISGIDDKSVEIKNLKIDENNFKAIDLNKSFNLGRRFDIVICLEVAEHLLPDSADVLIESITNASDAVLFSAAIKGQGGYKHINEQNQSYWIELFKQYKYEAFDLIRPLIWNNENIAYYYRQNSIIYARKQSSIYQIMENYRKCHNIILDNVVHPVQQETSRNIENNSIKEVISKLPKMMRTTISHVIKGRL